MRSLFRSFDRLGVDYLLISGQASVLYGAATFSEDVDIWVRPARENLQRLLSALAACRARVYKLTPALSARTARAGHGFHFVLPGRPIPLYLDVMAKPPRVGAFEAARSRARAIETEWGRLPVAAIEDIIRLKKTRRLSDYEVISNLVRVRLAEATPPSPSLIRWAARNTFRAEDRADYLGRLGRAVDVAACREEIAREVVRLQAKDSAYWRRRIDDLRRIRRRGGLLPVGRPVSHLL